MRRVDRSAVAAQVPENPRNDRRILDAGDHPQSAAAATADLDVDGKDALEALRPRQGALPVGRRWLAAIVGLAGSGGASAGHHANPIRARRREYTVIPGEVGTRLRYQRREACDEVLGRSLVPQHSARRIRDLAARRYMMSG
jgi:hypothetical protein